MEAERDDCRGRERPESDEEACTQLVQMLRKRGLLAVPEAAWQPAHAALVVLALGRLRNERRRFGWSKLLGRTRGMGACDRVLELPHPTSERAPDLRQSPPAEEQQRDHEDQDDVPRLCKSCHAEDGRACR